MIGTQCKVTFGAYRAMGLRHVLVPAVEPFVGDVQPLVYIDIELAFFKQMNVRKTK